MRNKIEIFGVFHDGTIAEIEGERPNISFRIEIEYLRQMFRSDGDSFWVHLDGCESFEYLDWKTKERISDYQRIVVDEPEILNVRQDGDTAVIVCTNGQLELVYSDVRLTLEDGTPVTCRDLNAMSNKYWSEWKDSKHRD